MAATAPLWLPLVLAKVPAAIAKMAEIAIKMLGCPPGDYRTRIPAEDDYPEWRENLDLPSRKMWIVKGFRGRASGAGG